MRTASLLCLLLFPACAGTQPASLPTDAPAQATAFDGRVSLVVEHWGAMREVLRDGQTQGRVVLAEVIGPHTIAVGAAAGLGAEITVDAGRAHLAEVVDAGSATGLRVREPRPGEEATLLVLADVPTWSEHTLPAVSDLDRLEVEVRAIAAANDLDLAAPFPFRVEGVARSLQLHVLDHSCPIADPDGPAPWRFAGTDEAAVLVGFYAEGAGGTLTHHGQRSHTHALIASRDVAGHLDDIELRAGARLFLPAH